MNNFIFIVPYRNIKPFIQKCIDSLLLQKNKNWKAIFCDDMSSDGSSSLVPDNKHFIKRINSERISALPNIHYSIIESDIQDEDIICILDGDDFLIREDSIDIIDKLYNDDTLLTYGQYVWPNGEIGHCRAYTKETFKSLRSGGYWASHMRTFKYKLYKELLNQDPNVLSFKDNSGNFYQSCYDVAIMTPLMEIAGFDRIKFNPTPIYYYRIHQQNDHFVDPTLQKDIANEVFAKKPFSMV